MSLGNYICREVLGGAESVDGGLGRDRYLGVSSSEWKWMPKEGGNHHGGCLEGRGGEQDWKAEP